MTLAAPIYSLDTSGLLDGLERYYLPAVFPQLWQRVDELIGDGRLLMSEEAWIEACQVDAPAKAWCQPRKAGLVVATDATIAQAVGQIGTEYPDWVVGTSNRVDPFVIAVAEARGAIVVTGEKNGSPQKPKIPFVCQERGVPYVSFLGLIQAEGWSF